MKEDKDGKKPFGGSFFGKKKAPALKADPNPGDALSDLEKLSPDILQHLFHFLPVSDQKTVARLSKKLHRTAINPKRALLGKLLQETHAKDLAALWDAVEQKDKKAVAALIKKRVNINAVVKDGKPVLCFAIGTARLEIATLLIKAGANVKVSDTTNGMTPLHLAVLMGNQKLAELLIKRGADVNAKNKEGNTPIHVATEHGAPECVKLLLQHGANCFEPNGKQQTPIDLAKYDLEGARRHNPEHHAKLEKVIELLHSPSRHLGKRGAS